MNVSLGDIRDNIKVADDYIDYKRLELSLIDSVIEEANYCVNRMNSVLGKGSYRNEEQMVGIRDNVERIYLNRLRESRELIVKQMTAAEGLRSVSYKALSDYEFAKVAGRQGSVEEFDMEDKIREMQRASYTFQELASLRS